MPLPPESNGDLAGDGAVMPPENYCTLSADKPLVDPEDDQLGYAPFARHLALSLT